MKYTFIAIIYFSLLTACSGQDGDKTGPASKPTKAKPATPNRSRLRKISDDFAEVTVETRTSFAHDRGDMTSIQQVEVNGKKVKPSDIAEALVKSRGGWTKAGKSDEQVAKKTALSLVLTLAKVTETDIVQDKTKPKDMSNIRRPSSAPNSDPNKRYLDKPDYHAPKAEIIEADSKKLIVVTYFVRGHIGRRGRHWSFMVEAFELKTGKRFVIPYISQSSLSGSPASIKYPQLPRSYSFSERG